MMMFCLNNDAVYDDDGDDDDDDDDDDEDDEYSDIVEHDFGEGCYGGGISSNAKS